MTYQAKSNAAASQEERRNAEHRSQKQDLAQRGPSTTAGDQFQQRHSAPTTTRLFSLQAQAQTQPAVQRIARLQAAADAAGSERDIETLPRAETRTHMHQLNGTAADSRQNPRKYAGLRGSTPLQRQVPNHGAVQYPALIGAKNTPIDTPYSQQMGASVTQMSRKDYQRWQGSLQAKAAPHGVMHQGNRSTVARWQNAAPVAQRLKLPKLPLTQKMKAGLVMAEASLTIIAGVAGLVAGVGFGAVPLVVPSILALVVGALKFGRGYLMYQEDAPEGKRLAAIDTIRTIEAGVALVGALMADPTSFYKIPSMIFAIAKSVRALATALADAVDAKTGKKPSVFVKGLRGLSAVAHAIEVAAAGFSAGAGLVDGLSAISAGTEVAAGTAKAVASAGGVGIAGAKAVRTADQFETLGKKPPEQNPNAAGAAPANGPDLAPAPANNPPPLPDLAPAPANNPPPRPDLAPAPANNPPPLPDLAPAPANNPPPQPDLAPAPANNPPPAQAPAATRDENEIKYAKQIAYGKRVAGIYDWSDETVYEMAITGSFDDNVRAQEEDTGPTPSYIV
ncbi:hypothetical protein [Roseobacter sp.]|uniref:hypothetical protein n=1 Tax=Roseobacter sp. TaxID=1907202 RepID=UPI00385D06A1